MLKVLIVDDQSLVSAGLSMIINAQTDMEVVGSAESGLVGVEQAHALEPDVVLMDVRMPDIDGIEATRRILAGPGPHPRIVILTTFDLDEYLMSAIKAGASGFLLKNTPPDDLLGAIRTVHSGDAVIAPSSTKRLIEHVALRSPIPANPHEFDCLTDREREVLLLIAKGMSNQEISKTMYLSETTVKTHVSKILEKLGVRDRVQAVVEAYEGGLVHPG
ncbi:MAG: response regulator transcription factor [Propionibacteriaceae bacterium]|nr:response regulator transcription factor [Propionibacteriaceae bacterium]